MNSPFITGNSKATEVRGKESSDVPITSKQSTVVTLGDHAGTYAFTVKTDTGVELYKIDTSGTITIGGGSTLQKALSGDILLKLTPSSAGSDSATVTAAAAGAYTKTITISLVDSAGAVHKWANLTLSATTSEAVADTDVAAPTVSDTTPDLVDGVVDVVLTYDTDGGSTKTYAAGDAVSMTVSATDILGYTIASVTFTDTMV